MDALPPTGHTPGRTPGRCVSELVEGLVDFFVPGASHLNLWKIGVLFNHEATPPKTFRCEALLKCLAPACDLLV